MLNLDYEEDTWYDKVITACIGIYVFIGLTWGLWLPALLYYYGK